MRYQGGKQKIAKYILPFIFEYLQNCDYYVEPFVGGGNILQFVNTKKLRFANDVFTPTVGALKEIYLSAERLPKNNIEFSKQDYQNLEKGIIKTEFSEFKYFPLFAYSGFGKFRGGFAFDRRKNRDFVKSSYLAALKQQKFLKSGGEIIFSVEDYKNLKIKTKSLIHCDPPYVGTERYKGCKIFDTAEFWAWARRQKAAGNIVLVSERTAPDDIKKILSMNRYIDLSLKNNFRRAENLYLV